MNSFLFSLIVSIGGGFLGYHITRASLVGYLWVTNTQLTGDQRYWFHDLGDLVFFGGMILGLVGFWIYRKKY